MHWKEMLLKRDHDEILESNKRILEEMEE